MSLSPIYPQNRPFIGTHPRLYPQTYPQGLLHPAPLEIQYLLCKGRTFGTYSSLVHLHLTFSGVVCILSLQGWQEHCPFTTRLRVLKLAIKDLTQIDERVIIALRNRQGSSWPPTVSISYIDNNHWLGAA